MAGRASTRSVPRPSILNRLASGFLRERLKNGGESDQPRPEPDETIPSHGNIRGGDYYGNKDGESP